MFEKLKIFYNEKIKNNKKGKYVCAIAIFVLAIIIYLFCSNLNGTANKKIEESDFSYVTELEKKLSDTLSKVQGCGKVSVVINVKSGVKTVIASKKETSETKDKKETVETPILVGGKTVTLGEEFPEIEGVLIVCEGASNISIMLKVQNAVSSFLNINANKIEILSMN